MSSEHEQDFTQGIQDSCEHHQGRRMQLHACSPERPTLIHLSGKNEAHQLSPDAEDARQPSISPQPHRQLLSALSHVTREDVVNARDGAMRVICYSILTAQLPRL